jgi:hypothetical protein
MFLQNDGLAVGFVPSHNHAATTYDVQGSLSMNGTVDVK